MFFIVFIVLTNCFPTVCENKSQIWVNTLYKILHIQSVMNQLKRHFLPNYNIKPMPFVSNQIISHLKAKFRRENLFADSDQYAKRKELNLSIVHFLQKKSSQRKSIYRTVQRLALRIK